MGIQVASIRFENSVPPLESILRRILERTGLKVRCSISGLVSVEKMVEAAKELGFKTLPTKESLTYCLEHSGYQSIIFWIEEKNGRRTIEFQTGVGFRKTLMSTLEEALLSLGGEQNTEPEM